MREKIEIIDSFRGKYYFLSNFYETKFVYDGEEWWSAEHAYQAAKTSDLATKEMIKKAMTPGRAKRLGKGVQSNDWQDRRLMIMKHILQAKFANPTLRGLLLETGETQLVEGNVWHDNFWGVCSCDGCRYSSFGTRKNHLGRLLMDLREELRHDNKA